jgi:hypothetical protein
LFGITYAYKTREKEGKPLDGEFLRAKSYIASYQRYAMSLQNPDGSFSTEWFARRDNRPDVDRKIQTSGHILEWLILSLPEEQLRSPAMVKSLDFVATSLANEPNRSWSIGPMGHSLHALLMYDERVFQGVKESPSALAGTSVRPVGNGDDEKSDASAGDAQDGDALADVAKDETSDEPAPDEAPIDNDAVDTATGPALRGPLLNLR